MSHNRNDPATTVGSRIASAQDDVDKRIAETGPRESRKRAAFKTLSGIVLAYAICIVPYQIYFDISYSAPHLITLRVADAIYLLLYANSAINPILYYLNNMEFRNAYKKLLNCKYLK